MSIPYTSDFAAPSRAHSADRHGAYRRAGDDDAAVLARYLWNTPFGEALYPTLQALEVACGTASTRRSCLDTAGPTGTHTQG